MLAAGLGLSAVLTTTRNGFAVMKWIGVAYLVWLGVKMIRRSLRSELPLVGTSPTSRKRLWLQGFITSAANPKAVVFFAALFPQFSQPRRCVLAPNVDPRRDLPRDRRGVPADLRRRRRLARVRASAGRPLDGSNRLAGSCLILAAVLLGLKTVQR